MDVRAKPKLCSCSMVVIWVWGCKRFFSSCMMALASNFIYCSLEVKTPHYCFPIYLNISPGNGLAPHWEQYWPSCWFFDPSKRSWGWPLWDHKRPPATRRADVSDLSSTIPRYFLVDLVAGWTLALTSASSPFSLPLQS